ncbi:MAG: PAS domain-containing protein [Caldilineae bacterium]|nr:PAS domain-containing protein [Caldilineae bacterium]
MSQPKPLGIAASERDLLQRDYLLRAAQAISEPLDLSEVLSRVIRTAVAMTGGQAGAIALVQAGGESQIVASYRLDPSFEMHLEPMLDHLDPAATPPRGTAGARAGEASTRDAKLTRHRGDAANEADDGKAERQRAADRRARIELAAEAALEPLRPAESPAPLARYDRRFAEGISLHTLADAPRTPEDPMQVLNLPLELADRTIGRIFVFRGEGAAAFTPLDSELLETFADQAAVAIHNADTHMRLAARERRLSAIVEHSPAGVLLLGPDGRVRSHNPAAARLLGRDGASLVGADAGDLIAMQDVQDRALPFTLPRDEASASLQGHLRLPDGHRGAWVQLTATPLPDPRQARAGWVIDLVDLSGYREAEDARRAFLAGLSHELKTPLSLIRGYAETMRYPQVRADDALHAEAIEVILDETEHLTRLVDQLLTAARLEAEALQLDLHTVDLGGELERLVQGFRHAHPDHVWQLELPEALQPLQADPARLREIFGNLLGNAAKYAPAGSTVSLRASAEAGGLRVDVSDAGIGIGEADQERVFERFFRAAEQGQGAGLGLYMARAIAEAHGGRIDLASQPGKGSTFSVWLPADSGAADAEPPGPAGTASPHSSQEPTAP